MLSESQLKIIAEHPLGDTLNDIRDKLRACTNQLSEAVLASTLGALVTSSAALELPTDGGLDVAERLFAIRRNVRGGTLNPAVFRLLIDAIVLQTSDTDIWEAVLTLIQDVKSPPASSITPTFFGTPVKTSLSRLSDSETRDVVERELFFEIKDCTHRAVPGFFRKHFSSLTNGTAHQHMVKSILTNHDGKRWKDFPTDPWERPVWEWLTALEKNALSNASYVLHTNRTDTEFKERKGQMDIFFRKQNTDRRSTYKDVLVVGEHKRSASTSEFKTCLLQLTRHVRSIFMDQPMRRFVHAFTLRGTKMELWVYDRSGPYSSGEFDIHQEPEKLAEALVAYSTMDDIAMGLDTVIEWKNGHRYVHVTDADGGDDRRVELNALLVRQRAVVCRGTTCFSTRQGVAKLSWRSDKRPSEVKHLNLAQRRGVEGVATLVAHRELTTISDIRAGLEFSSNTQHIFRFTALERSESAGRLPGTDVSGSSRKRKSSEGSDGQSTKRRSDSQRSGHFSRSSHRPSVYTQDQADPYENRILSCLVISPAGRIVSDFRSVQELLEALLDAIKAHKSLYIKGRILHRDISSNNIIITDHEKSGHRGMLIDLDLAKEQDSGPSGARHKTGTMQFMAIEVLRGIDHTYRHDLESFFYVLLWMCARRSWKYLSERNEEEPSESVLRKWEIGRFKDIADAKEGHMTVNGLERIMAEFPQAFEAVKPLCLTIRSILFGDTARLTIGTPAGDPNYLYEAIITAYEDTMEEV